MSTVYCIISSLFLFLNYINLCKYIMTMYKPKQYLYKLNQEEYK